VAPRENGSCQWQDSAEVWQNRRSEAEGPVLLFYMINTLSHPGKSFGYGCSTNTHEGLHRFHSGAYPPCGFFRGQLALK
jgi:hypothetical protein